ncbi:MAG TPA: Crp/Fnr family transcriptional regulator [Terriglobales bacterium]|nr:Crp/Fnr family transcriptional regulator [Terriglobales bacterium]
MADAADAKSGRASVLGRVPIFADLSQAELRFLAERAVPRRYAAGELIFNEGDPCNGLYIVESGAVRIFKTSAGGREQVLTVEQAGSSVAELPVFDGGAYPASAMVAAESTLLFISRSDFRALCVEHPEVALKVLRMVGLRLRRLVGIIEELSFTTVRHRLAGLLLRLAREAGHRSGRADFQVNVSNQELASQIGTVRELVSRNLSRLQAEGLIQMEGKNITIPDLARLEAEIRDQQG